MLVLVGARVLVLLRMPVLVPMQAPARVWVLVSVVALIPVVEPV